MKRALFILLGIYAGASVSLAQVAPVPAAPRRHAAPELDWAVAGPALALLVGMIAIVRGRRSR